MLKRLILALLFASIIFCLPAAADQKDVEIAALKEQVKQLRSENQGLRLQLGQGSKSGQDQQAAPAPTTETQKRVGQAVSIQQQAEQSCWMTSSSSKRHNSSCRYYKNSKGRACTKNEGIPCKICGG